MPSQPDSLAILGYTGGIVFPNPTPDFEIFPDPGALAFSTCGACERCMAGGELEVKAVDGRGGNFANKTPDDAPTGKWRVMGLTDFREIGAR